MLEKTRYRRLKIIGAARECYKVKGQRSTAKGLKGKIFVVLRTVAIFHDFRKCTNMADR